MSFMSTCHLKGTVRKHKHYQQPLEHKNAPNYCFSKNLNETMYHIERNILLFVCLTVSVIVKQQENFIRSLKMHYLIYCFGKNVTNKRCDIKRYIFFTICTTISVLSKRF